MDLHATLTDLEATFSAIEQVLDEEFQSLSVLDPAGIEAAALKKLALDEKLRSFGGKLPDRPQIRAAIERLKGAAQVNQALLIHARACLMGALEVVTGGPAESISYARPLTTRVAGRINVRG
jgi:hypothetical protein